MAQGPQRSDSVEILMIIGAMSGLCLLIAGAVADLSVRVAQDVSRSETADGPVR